MLEDFFVHNPFELTKSEKEGLLFKRLQSLTELHRSNCTAYSNFLDALNCDRFNQIEDIPFLPVRVFKEMDLLSIDRKAVFKTMTSSGTTGQRPSKIFIDKETAMCQQKVMTRILSDYWGNKRLPLVIIDSPAVLKDRAAFAARGAAVSGLMFIAKETVYCLNEDMSLNTEVLDAFLQKYAGQKIILFGFTFMVWQHFYKELLQSPKKYDFSNAFLMTGGGWKKMEADKVSREEFKSSLKAVCGISHFIDHYGMVEQVGAIYTECEYGHLHSSIFSDVIVRNYENFSPCKIGEKGIIQVLSSIPQSYPGHSLLTEDEGMIVGEDDCPCGRKGKYIKVLGRIKNAELRGCSDTYASKFN